MEYKENLLAEKDSSIKLVILLRCRFGETYIQ